MSNILLRCLFFNLFILFGAGNSMSMTGKEISNHLSTWLLDKGIEGSPIFSKKVKLKNCDTKLKINRVFEGYNTLRVICPDEGGFNLAIRVVLKKNIKDNNKINTNNSVKNSTKIKSKVKIKHKKIFQLVTLNKAMEKNSILTINDLEIVSSNKLSKSSFFNNKKFLIGRKIKKNLKMGQILHPRHIFEKFEIEVGDALSIVSSIGKAFVIVNGEAQNSGNLGDLIRVKNLRSGKVVKGYVKENKIIKVFR